jgi:hypothetical protein
VGIIVTHGLREKSERFFNEHQGQSLASADAILNSSLTGWREVETYASLPLSHLNIVSGIEGEIRLVEMDGFDRK